MKHAFTAIAVAGGLCLPAAAQEKRQVVVHEAANVIQRSGAAATASAGVRIMSMSAEAVKGAPYSAEAVSESIQMLADGNRITHTSRSMQYRDSEGRTRTDNTLSPVGIWVPESRDVSISNINDPVLGEHFMLDHDRKTAVKSSLRTIAAHAGPGAETKEVRVEVKQRAQAGAPVFVSEGATFAHAVPPPAADVLVGPGPAVMMLHAGGAEGAAGIAVKTESLGKRIIEGLECEGTRETLTIEAGKIGNERPIQTVTERWYSARLRQDILRKTTDPRFGEMTYKLTRITQSEQPRSLFEVPPDYKVEDMKNTIQFMRQQGKE